MEKGTAAQVAKEVKTAWRVYAWWLVAFKGYRVVLWTMEPRNGPLRLMRYTNRWILAAWQ